MSGFRFDALFKTRPMRLWNVKGIAEVYLTNNVTMSTTGRFLNFYVSGLGVWVVGWVWRGWPRGWSPGRHTTSTTTKSVTRSLQSGAEPVQSPISRILFDPSLGWQKLRLNFNSVPDVFAFLPLFCQFLIQSGGEGGRGLIRNVAGTLCLNKFSAS